MKLKRVVLSTLSIGVIAVLGVGCGSSDSSSASSISGNLVDAAVQGANYTCSTSGSGSTDSTGKFTCSSGSSPTVTFKLGNSITIGSFNLSSIPSDKNITPFELAGIARGSDYNNQAVLNIARTLQTLDSDGDPSNGITVDSAKVSQIDALGKTYNLSDTTKNIDSTLVNDISNAGLGITFKTADQAKTHLQSTVESIDSNTSGGTTSSYGSLSISAK